MSNLRAITRHRVSRWSPITLIRNTHMTHVVARTPQHALVFAASGAIAGSVATALAARGMHVHCSAPDAGRLKGLVSAIQRAGGSASAEAVDATDPAAVRAYVDGVHSRVGRIDVVFNGIGGHPATLGYPARSLEQPLERFLVPLTRIVGSQFLTAREAARHMVAQGCGSIILLSATLSGGRFANMAGITAACGAVETLTGALAGDVGPSGVRVNCVRANAMPETRTIQETFAGQVALTGAPPIMPPPLTNRALTVADTADVVAFLASDDARGVTAQVLTATMG
jgi:3-oxoacyl-[acyl-carrier protein] reductase